MSVKLKTNKGDDVMLTASERNYILESMENLLEEYDYTFERDALEDIIDEWAEKKGALIRALKRHPKYVEGKFMVAFDADYERVVDKKESLRFRDFLLNGVMATYKDGLPSEIKEQMNYDQALPHEIFNFFYGLENYAYRVISEETAEYLNRVVPAIHAHPGQKTSRVVNKLCCYLGYNKADGYNAAFARYADSLSPLIIKRHTVLSVNPLDYLTMSFGNSWASCHTIDKANKRRMPNSYSGAYSSGTISYMLDESSMVFYTVDASYNGNEYWSQPKINRQMFHYGEDKLVQGRLYPQDNDGDDTAYVPYRNIVQKIMSETFNFPNLWVLRKGTEAASRYINSRGTHYEDYHYYCNCSLSTVKGSENENLFNVGARPICIKCGNRHSEEDNINCCDTGKICDDCGCRIRNEDDEYWIDGECFCRDCVSYCERCGEYHRSESYYIESEDRHVCEWCYQEHYSYCEDCHRDVDYEDGIYVESVGRFVCDDCIDEHYTRCSVCDEYFPNDEVTENEDGEWVCENCHEEEEEEA